MSETGLPVLELDERLQRCLVHLPPEATPADGLIRLVDEGLDRLPQPAAGATLHRWQALATVAAHDLSLAKLFEGHTDALAIMQELSESHPFSPPPGSTWGMWAAEAPDARVLASEPAEGWVRLDGEKRWCSGAATCTHALLTAWPADGEGPQLVAIALDQPGIEVRHDAWRSVGMARSMSLDVTMHGVRGRQIGGAGAYLSRPGFWHGGAGVAACWFGGARALAQALRARLHDTPPEHRDPLKLAALGRVDLAMTAASAMLRDAARWLDLHPRENAMAVALRVRLAAEDAATRVLEQAGRALGATSFCRDARFARMAADLPVFVRQSHGDRDLAALASSVLTLPAQAAWQL